MEYAGFGQILGGLAILGGVENGIWLLDFTRDILVDFRDRLAEGEGDWENSKLECVIEDLKNIREKCDKEVEGEAEEKEESEDQVRQDPEAEDKVSVDPEEDHAQGRAEGETQTEEDDMRQALGLEEEEGEAEEKEEREDDAQGQDEGFKEDDQGSRDGARKRGLTREWLDLLFYDSEEDADESFDEGEEERPHQGVRGQV